MRIGLFALEVGRKVGGLEVYETDLIRGLAEVDRENEYVIFSLDPSVPEILNLDAPNFRYSIVETGRLKGVLYDAPRAMAREKLDLFHAMFVPPPFTSVPYVFTHHGTEVMERPDFYPFLLALRMRFLFRRAFKKARLIICSTKHVEAYTRDKLGVAPERLRQVYYGRRPIFRPIDREHAKAEVAVKYNLTTPYLLNVGRIEPRKNPIRIVESYARFRERAENPPKLVFAGMKTWSGEEFDETIRRLKLEGEVLSIGHVPHDDVPLLYSASEFAVFPTLWEGFGMPVTEAFGTGTPVITSNTTSLPEIAGGAALLVDPYNIEEIADAIGRLHRDPVLRNQLAAAGLARAEYFNWHLAARNTIQVYREAVFMSPDRQHAGPVHN